LNITSQLIKYKQQLIQDFLNANEIQHLQKQAAITNLTNEVIVNKNFLLTHSNGTDISEKGSSFSPLCSIFAMLCISVLVYGAQNHWKLNYLVTANSDK
jgi:hypothetical protein